MATEEQHCGTGHGQHQHKGKIDMLFTLKSATCADLIMHEMNGKVSATETGDEQVVSLSQRAAPFIEMLESAVKAGEPVVCGV